MRRPPRWIAALPLVFFILTWIDYLRTGTGYNIAWLCHLSNIVLAGAILASLDAWIWVTTVWIVLGSTVWVWDLWVTDRNNPFAILTHFGGMCVGLWMIRAVPKPRHLWLRAMAYLAAIQLGSRWLTPESMNVNVSHRVHPALVAWFPGYWSYWVFNLVFFAVGLFFTERLLERYFLKRPTKASARATALPPAG